MVAPNFNSNRRQRQIWHYNSQHDYVALHSYDDVIRYQALRKFWSAVCVLVSGSWQHRIRYQPAGGRCYADYENDST